MAPARASPPSAVGARDIVVSRAEVGGTIRLCRLLCIGFGARKGKYDIPAESNCTARFQHALGTVAHCLLRRILGVGARNSVETCHLAAPGHTWYCVVSWRFSSLLDSTLVTREPSSSLLLMTLVLPSRAVAEHGWNVSSLSPLHYHKSAIRQTIDSGTVKCSRSPVGTEHKNMEAPQRRPRACGGEVWTIESVAVMLVDVLGCPAF